MKAAAPLDAVLSPPALARLGVPYVETVPPTPLPEPKLLHFNSEAATLIGLDPREAERPDFIAAMAGNRLPAGIRPLSSVYAGHQFGVFVPQLGDGRAILLGQANGRELQLKGAGKTPYSRFGDGRAVVRSTVREYLCGEAMHALGIPTTRALCIVTSPAPVQRETTEHAAVLCRMAPSHLRFGHFEYFYYRQEFEALKPLADFVIAEYFPALAERTDKCRAWLTEVVERTARLMAQWQAAGFSHGVMNTDNMSVLGLTLDYGPYGFMDGFESHFICNHTDEGGRYAYDQQPGIGHWNCSRLLQATLPLLSAEPDEAVEIANGILEAYGPTFVQANLAHWRAKLGLREPRDGDPELVNRFLNVLDRGRSDFTLSFRRLADVRSGADAPAPPLADFIADRERFDPWLADYRARLRAESSDDAERAARMNRVNPKFVLRNWLAQEAIAKAEAGDAGGIDSLLMVLRRPYDEHPGQERLAGEPPDWARTLSVSCSS